MDDGVFKRRIYPWEAVRALISVLRDKEDTSEVFRMLDAIDKPAQERNFQRFSTTEVGRKVLSEKRNLCDILSNQESLQHLPSNSLGHAYLMFLKTEGLSLEGLQKEMDASDIDHSDFDEDRLRFLYRCRHSHDLLHVITGYGRDYIGELALLAFTYQQSKLRTFALLSSFGLITAYRKYPGLPALTVVREAHRIGKTERSLFFADWESLIEKPLDAIRQEYGIQPPRHYLSIASKSNARDRIYREKLNQELENSLSHDRAA